MRFDSCDRPSYLTKIGFKPSNFHPVWPWNVIDDLEKQQSTSFVLYQVLWIISNPSGWAWKPTTHLVYTMSSLFIVSKPWVNSNWSYSPETLDSGLNQRFFPRVTLEFDRWSWKIMGHILYTTSSVAQHLGVMGEFKPELQPGNDDCGSK